MTLQPDFVIFDCDGVLVDSERLTNQVLRDDLAARGLDLPLHRIMDLFVGGTMSGVMKEMQAKGIGLPDDWLDIIYPRIYAVLADSVEAIPGVSTVLDRLDASFIPYAVGSNGRIEKMEVTLGRVGLLHRFEDRLYSGQDLAAPKPAPDVYLHAAKQAATAPEKCIVIEDSATGAQAAKRAGMRCFGFIRDTAADHLAPYCTALFDDMDDLPELLSVR